MRTNPRAWIPRYCIKIPSVSSETFLAHHLAATTFSESATDCLSTHFLAGFLGADVAELTCFSRKVCSLSPNRGFLNTRFRVDDGRGEAVKVEIRGDT